MIHPYLTTKLYIPQPRPNQVARTSLIEKLQDGLHEQRRAALVCAPAGFGKTTLVSAWVTQTAQPIVWLTLDQSDNDPRRFITLLIAGLQTLSPEIGNSVEQLCTAPQLPPLPELAASLINDLVAADIAPLMILDDYHQISTTSIHQFIDQLLYYLPTLMQIVMITREDPPIRIARLRARGQITEIRERDLRFSSDEAAQFLKYTMRLNLSDTQIDALAARTEGWIAGLQMAALAIQETPENTEKLIAEFTGSDRYIMDYLMSEVLEHQPSEIQDFLLMTAILDRLSPALCDTISGRTDSAVILEYLDKANLFLIPLDRHREWYRYYQLFAEFLRTQIAPEKQALLHHRAAVWYELQGLTHPAIHHALASAQLTGNYTTAARLIAANAEGAFLSGAVVTVSHWVEALPDELVRSDGQLAFYRAAVSAMMGDHHAAEEYAQIANPILQNKTPRGYGKLLALLSFMALNMRCDYDRVIALASKALEMLGADHPQWQVLALWSMAEALERTGSISRAIDTLRSARPLAVAVGSALFVAVIDVALVIALRYQGKRYEAIVTCKTGIDYFTDSSGFISPLAALLYSHLGLLFYEANQLDTAFDHLQHAIALSQQFGVKQYNIFTRALAAPLLHLRGQTHEALINLQHAAQTAKQTGLTDSEYFFAAELDLHLRRGEYDLVAQQFDTAGYSNDMTVTYAQIESQIVYARLLVEQDNLTDAARWLTKLEQFIQDHELYGLMIQVRILQAVVVLRSGDKGAARGYLTQAVRFAEHEEFLRFFIDAPTDILSLLTSMRHLAPRFIDRILNATSTNGLRYAANCLNAQRDQLSEREQEVLQLIAAGLSNAEIGARLFISIATVKRHINHIYDKLAIHSRTEAMTKARAINLLLPE